MARLIVLDSTPLGLACGNPGHPRVDDFGAWLSAVPIGGSLVVIPEIADYEVRRGLIYDGRANSLRRLDAMRKRNRILYAPLSTPVMQRAATLWAEARWRGVPTAGGGRDDRSIDADVIVAAQALDVAGPSDQVVVATSNVAHLSRYLDAQDWEAITP